MAFTPRTVKDQIVEFPNRFKIDGVSHIIEPDFGIVTEPGTEINKAYLQPIEDALGEAVTKEEFNSHLADKVNPHEVTKSQVGLGNVQNYGIATQIEAEEGTVNNKYMTPQRTKQAIDKARAIMGAYTGNGAASRVINLGVTPKAVFLSQLTRGPFSEDRRRAGFDMANRSNDSYKTLHIVSNGFTVYDNKNTNFNTGILTNVEGEIYEYLAIL